MYARLKLAKEGRDRREARRHEALERHVRRESWGSAWDLCANDGERDRIQFLLVAAKAREARGCCTACMVPPDVRQSLELEQQVALQSAIAKCDWASAEALADVSLSKADRQEQRDVIAKGRARVERLHAAVAAAEWETAMDLAVGEREVAHVESARSARGQAEEMMATLGQLAPDAPVAAGAHTNKVRSHDVAQAGADNIAQSQVTIAGLCVSVCMWMGGEGGVDEG